MNTLCKGGKLVRDKIPEIIAKNEGAVPEFRVLGDAEYAEGLRDKLVEEVGEYLASGEVEELADILEVVYALAARDGLSPVDLERVRAEKRDARGGFDGRVKLLRTPAYLDR
jgi:predicted house-cleaning noncanonical NTP pyrophosphatase (MazG superfamily)